MISGQYLAINDRWTREFWLPTTGHRQLVADHYNWHQLSTV